MYTETGTRLSVPSCAATRICKVPARRKASKGAMGRAGWGRAELGICGRLT